jgi:hypothetical protein
VKGLRGILTNIATALSLVLCVATVALWVRSHCRLDPKRPEMRGEDWYWFDFTLEAYSVEGELLYTWWPNGFAHGQHPAYWRGFAYQNDEFAFTLGAPHWAILLLAVLLPAGRILGIRRRHAPNSCRACGYDLRATPDRCPECGALPGKIPN